MKKLLKISMLFILSVVLLTYCKKDDDEKEEIITKPLDATTVTDKISNAGAIKIAGTPPAPTGAGAPVLKAASNEASGVIEFGAKTNFTVSGDFSGVYVLVEGASSYLKIPLNGSGDLKKVKDKLSNTTASFRTKEDDEDDLEFVLEFKELATPGTFCYEICLYDEENNISNIERICVTVAGFGGNNSLVGKWKYEKNEYFENGTLIDYETYDWDAIEIDECFDEDEDEFVEYTYKYQTSIELKSNGDYFRVNNEILLGNYPSCAGVWHYNDVLNYTMLGKWSYNTTTKDLILIELEENVNYETPLQDKYIFDEGEIYFKGFANVIGSTLTLTGEYGNLKEILTFKKF